ncbi:FH2 domain-containing protein [Trichonephila clavipes]|nr:FH2 domain-containing protein [Trichonephila clavipes]
MISSCSNRMGHGRLLEAAIVLSQIRIHVPLKTHGVEGLLCVLMLACYGNVNCYFRSIDHDSELRDPTGVAVVKQCKDGSNSDLAVQLDVFDEQRQTDEGQFSGPDGVDLSSHMDVFFAILRQVYFALKIFETLL